MELDQPTRDRIADLIGSSDVMLFMKGNRQQPQCGFSATVVKILDTYVPSYETLDVLSNPEIRDGIKLFSSWPTVPQLYVKGEFVGGCDIIQELDASGELIETLGLSLPEAGATPAIEITEAAADGLANAVEQQGGPGRELRLTIDACYRATLTMAPAQGNDVIVDAGSVKLHLDPLSASRADGLKIDLVETPGGQGFKIDNPNAPEPVQLSVADLKSWQDQGRSHELIDVRTPAEREQASISGSVLLTQQETARIQSLPLDTTLVFFCHHGGRSQAAAEHFASLGFKDVHNLVGGIDAWSREIDSSIQRY